MAWKLKDITGNRFGRLIAIEPTIKSKSGSFYWKCKCDCGCIKEIAGANLRRGFTTSCGCKTGERLGRHVYAEYKHRAKKRNTQFDIPIDTFMYLVREPCYYCDSEPQRMLTLHNSKKTIAVNGLDRLDNNYGYTIDNVVPCCYACNLAKRNLTLGEFIDLCVRVSDNFRYSTRRIQT